MPHIEYKRKTRKRDDLAAIVISIFQKDCLLIKVIKVKYNSRALNRASAWIQFMISQIWQRM